ncbi:MAG: GtrA family protein [Sphingopyxis sp.]|nr:GtrA family protein [Sphingopyxis sp.]
MINGLMRRGPRYLGVSLFCFLFNNALFILLDQAGMWFGISVAISFALLTPLGFILQSRATVARGVYWSAFGRYALLMLANQPIAFLLLFLIHDRIGVPMLYAAPIATASMLIWNYAMTSWIILSRRISAR